MVSSNLSPGEQYCRGELRPMRRTREVLRLEREPVALAIGVPAPARKRTVEEVARVKLKAWLSCMHCQSRPDLGSTTVAACTRERATGLFKTQLWSYP